MSSRGNGQSRKRSDIQARQRWWLSGAGLSIALLAVWLTASALGLGRSTESGGGSLTEVEERGRIVYQANCASCHGQRGEGQPNWKSPRADGTYPAPPQDRTGHTWHHADGLLFGIVKEGGGFAAPVGYPATMPAWRSTLSDAQIIEVLSYIKTMWGPEERDFQMKASQQNPYPPGTP